MKDLVAAEKKQHWFSVLDIIMSALRLTARGCAQVLILFAQ